MAEKIISKRLALFFLYLSLICMIAYQSIGSTVDEQGILHEPFALIPIGWIAFVLCLITVWIYLARKLRALEKKYL